MRAYCCTDCNKSEQVILFGTVFSTWIPKFSRMILSVCCLLFVYYDVVVLFHARLYSAKISKAFDTRRKLLTVKLHIIEDFLKSHG